MYCENCGEKIDGAKRFCPGCGNKIKKEGKLVLIIVLVILVIMLLVEAYLLIFPQKVVTVNKPILYVAEESSGNDNKYKHLVLGDEDNYIAKYNCKSYNCALIYDDDKYSSLDDKVEGDHEFKYVLVYDNEFIIYNFKNDTTEKTGIKLTDDEISINNNLMEFKIALLFNRQEKLPDYKKLGSLIVYSDDVNYYYSGKYKKIIKVKDGKISNLFDRYGEIEITPEDGEPYLLDIVKNKKSSIYLTDIPYDGSYFTEDKIVAKYKSKNLKYGNDKCDDEDIICGSIRVTLYENNYMEVSAGDGAVSTEYSRGTYEIKDNKLIYNRMYRAVGSLNGIEFEISKKYTDSHPVNSNVFKIQNNTLNTIEYEIFDDQYNVNLENTYIKEGFSLK